ncbi:MAG: LysR family transcriptional regulator, partial [Clostridia bacterium]|nr:LysR family transcriptional regulator [Clostridia bacterium]
MIDYHMETFVTLCECMNYRKTAEILNMTQPAVTQHIHYLEEHYKCRLFVYDHRKLSMTPQAEILLSHARNLEYQENILREKMMAVSKSRVHIGATKTIGEYVIGAHLSEYIRSVDKEVSVTVSNTEILLEQLDHGELDFAVIEGSFDHNRYASRLYASVEFVGICSVNHQFAGKTVSMEECFSQRLLIREPGSGTRKIFESIMKNKNCGYDDFSDTISANHTGLITDLVNQNCGISFAYKSVADKTAG